MNKHKLRTAVLLSVILCFIIVSPAFIRGTSAYIVGQSNICRANFYGETPVSSVPESSIPVSSVPESSVPESSYPESSVPESSVPESSVPESSTTTKTGDGTNPLPIATLMFFSVIILLSVFAALTWSEKHRDTDDR